MKKRIVRITLEVDDKLRADLKARAAKKYMTLKSWILAAIVKELKEEKDEAGYMPGMQ